MQALKALVIFMGILLCLGSVALVYAIIHHKPTPTRPVTAAAQPLHATLALPPGAHIEQMAGVGERLALRIATPDGRQSLLLIDPASGAILETLDTP